MKRSRPSGLTLLAGALLLLMPALAVLQFRWVGQVSDAEQERMQRNVAIAARQFREAFDSEILRAYVFLQVGAETSRDTAWHRYATRYEEWLNAAGNAQLVRNVYLVDAEGPELRLRRWDAAARTFQPVAWPGLLEKWRPEFQQELTDFALGLPPDREERRARFRGESSLIVAPQRPITIPSPAIDPAEGARRQTSVTVFGFTVLELDLQYVRERLLPELVQRHFTHADGDSYRVAVVDADDGGSIIYRSDPEAPTDPDQADATQGFFQRFGLVRGGPPQRTTVAARPDTDPQLVVRGRGDELPGRWRLLAQHQSGSLEAAVAGVRSRNLAISFGVLMLLTVSIGLLTVSSRRAQRLAQQQMEFVASVSHELRTPVAVIKSAAENLSQGVVGNTERVKRYGVMIEGEARRLAEMVERVLQYAGIESGLGYGARSPLAPAEIVQSAIDSALPLLGPDTVNVHREIRDPLPPVVGDAAALRSAVQNLVANAVKYGGTDRWVGVRAEHVREAGRSDVRISVSDHGPGIPAGELPRIFDPFYRGGDALARQIHGNGLGLSLVKRIVTAHGGQVTVTTRPGAGSTFTITLPAAEPDASTSVAGGVRAAVHP